MKRNNPVAYQAYLDGRISPVELAAELSGVADVDRCIQGDSVSCAWAVSGAVPVGKIPHVARAIQRLDNLRAAGRVELQR